MTITVDSLLVRPKLDCDVGYDTSVKGVSVVVSAPCFGRFLNHRALAVNFNQPLLSFSIVACALPQSAIEPYHAISWLGCIYKFYTRVDHK